MSTQLKEKLIAPAIEITKRILEIFFLFDTSSSMAGNRIAVANQAMREVLGLLPDLMKDHPEVELKARCIGFASDAYWHMGPEPCGIEGLSWKNLKAGGCTSTGAAVNKLTQQITRDKMPRKGLPPVMILVSDGDNTDGSTYDQAITALEGEPWGRKAIRLAIGIGDDYNRNELEKFTNQPEIGVLEAKTAVDLINYIRFGSTVGIKSSIDSSPLPAAPVNNQQIPCPSETVRPDVAELEVL